MPRKPTKKDLRARALRGWETRRQNQAARERAERAAKKARAKKKLDRKGSGETGRGRHHKPPRRGGSTPPAVTKKTAQARSAAAKKGWVTRKQKVRSHENKRRERERTKGLGRRKEEGTLSDDDKRVLEIRAIRHRIMRGGDVSPHEFLRNYGYIRRDGTIAASWSRLRVYTDDGRIKDRLEGAGNPWSESFVDEAWEIAEEYDVDVKEVYSLFFS